MQGWIRRAFDLQIIEESTYRKMCILFGRNHWKKIEPTEFHGNEEPSRLRLMTLRALSEGLISVERAEELCPGCSGRFDRAATTPCRLSPSELRRLTKEQQHAILAAAAAEAAKLYESDPELTDFEAFGEDDLYDKPAQSK